MTTLITATLILGDGHRLSASIFLPIGVIAFVLPLIWPDIRSVPALKYPNDNVWWAGLLDGLAGTATGLVLGALGSWRWRIMRGQWPAFAPIAWSCAVGVVLGWQRTTYSLPASVVLCLTAVHVLRMIRRPEEQQDSEALAAKDADSSGEPLDASEGKGSGVFGGGSSDHVEDCLPPKTPDPVQVDPP